MGRFKELLLARFGNDCFPPPWVFSIPLRGSSFYFRFVFISIGKMIGQNFCFVGFSISPLNRSVMLFS